MTKEGCEVPEPRANVGPRLRVATPDDAGVVAEIFNQSIAAGGACLHQRLKSSDEIRRQIEGFGPRELILLLEDERGAGGEPWVLGWGIIKRYSERGGYAWACETAVYCRRDLVGRGHGTRIKKALIARCEALGYHHMVAKIFADNRASIEYNLRLGYELVGVQKEIGFQDGRWRDIVILQKILDTPPPVKTSEVLDADGGGDLAPPQPRSGVSTHEDA